MARAIVNEDRCKGCGLCVPVCPKKIMELQRGRLNSKGYSPAAMTDEEKCIGCALCAMMCPDVAITVEK